MLTTGTKLVMIGDSITDCGRTRPIGEGAIENLGSGYAALVAARVAAERPELGVTVRNTGISGDTVRDLDRRWQSDVIDLAPSVLTVMIGINDIWRLWGAPADHVPLTEYEETLERLLAQVRSNLSGLVLLTPFLIETDPADEFLTHARAYGTAVKRIADRQSAVVVDTQALYDRCLAHIPASALSGDRVHPNLTGHTVLANGVLAALAL